MNTLEEALAVIAQKDREIEALKEAVRRNAAADAQAPRLTPALAEQVMAAARTAITTQIILQLGPPPPMGAEQIGLVREHAAKGCCGGVEAILLRAGAMWFREQVVTALEAAVFKVSDLIPVPKAGFTQAPGEA